MADKKGVGHAYNVDFLNVVFAATSLFLFLSVIWMVWDDYDRDWKNTQRHFAQLEDEVTAGAGSQQAGRGGRQDDQAAGARRRGSKACAEEGRGQSAEGGRASAEAEGPRQPAVPRDGAIIQSSEGDVRP